MRLAQARTGAMQPSIGCTISLISNAEIRYEGTLFGFDAEERTIVLENVASFGTEGRRLPDVAKAAERELFLVFRGNEIKDWTVLSSTGPPATAIVGLTSQSSR